MTYRSFEELRYKAKCKATAIFKALGMLYLPRNFSLKIETNYTPL